MSVNSAAGHINAGAVDVEIPTIPVGTLAPWALFTFLFAAVVVFFLSSYGSVDTQPGGLAVHEWVHDGRHLLGFPCH